MAKPTPTKDDDYDKDLLVARLKKFYALSQEGEPARQAADRRGAKLFYGQFFESGLQAGTMPVAANLAATYFERLVASITRNKPIPQIEPVGHDDSDAARLLQGAILSNWGSSQMQWKIYQGELQVGSIRPALWYVEWESERRGGIGDINTHIIPGYRSIIDDRTPFIDEMEFAGFSQTMSRAKLTQLFPSKASEIEAAASSGKKDGPFEKRSILRQGSENLEISTRGMGPPSITVPSATPSGRRITPIGGPGSADPLAEQIDVIWLWFRDPSTEKTYRPKLDELRRPIKRVIRNEEGEIQFETAGHEVIQGPYGAMYLPNLAPKTEVVMEPAVVAKYKNRRHVVFVPTDSLVLHDVDWSRRVPLLSQRTEYALDGYWSTGFAQRLIKAQNARNYLLTQIFKVLKYNQSGSWLASWKSGIEKSELFPDPGRVYKAAAIDDNNLRPFPHQALGQEFFAMVNSLESEMLKLLGISSVMQGESAGRVDNAETYGKLIDQASVAIVNKAQMLEKTIHDWCLVVMEYVQDYYTHEHYVEMEEANGSSTWKAASALSTRGEFAVRIETGSMVSYSAAAQFAAAKEFAAMGFYTLPMLGKLGNVPYYHEALRQKQAIINMGPNFAWLLGSSAASPTTQAKIGAANATSKRNHHTNPVGESLRR